MKNDGGAAFPCFFPGSGQVQDDANVGMTLRDYFAAKAMHGELVTAGALPEPAEALATAASVAGRSIEEQIAFNAYKLADAMLAERSK